MKTKFPFILTLLSMILGVLIAILFGANESMFKNKITNDLQKNQKIMSITDSQIRAEKLANEAGKNWRYYQRFHFHATGISAMTLGVLILLSFSLAPITLRLVGSYALAIGGFLYPFVWLFAALYGPILGRHAAKEQFAIFGYMGGVFFVSLIFCAFLLAKYPLSFNKQNH